ncbi:hypothetical protein GNI_191910 [Gregarina niphandrodes]|uniref:Integrase zinc-binding domain-containing protein n=1 Tax=Gregarina niphandrodes TaxID=110365 RepID=A0A023AXM5_GRENI|nr:hypothetical protein GNI_191910 [Gregarina niphandrodes]EZG43050.1 hypothetical protein GNI_191910 [Gregarina niphandrodes]|eukprot:XP_011133678.1 hypothetical protein GNI_191910 [Gregarina niphandrodes]
MDDESDAILDTIAMRVGAVGRSKQLELPTLPSDEEFLRAYEAMPPEGVPGVRREGKWYIETRTGKVYVPGPLRARVLVNFHYGPSGHLGVTRTRKRLLTLFSWPGLGKDVAGMIRECLICTRLKRPPVPAHEVPTGE